MEIENNTGFNVNQTETVETISEKMEYGTFPLTDKKVKDLAFNAVMSRKRSVDIDHNSRVQKFDKWEKMYSSESTEKTKETLANINSTQIWNSVEDWTAQIMDAVFSVDPPIDVKSKPGQKAVPREVASKIKAILWQNAKDTNIFNEFENGTREGVKLGTFAYKVIWKLDDGVTLKTKEIPRMVPGMNMPLPPQQIVEQEIVVEERPLIKAVDLRNLWFRPDKISWVIEKTDSNWSAIDKQARLFNVYDNLENAKKTSYPGQSNQVSQATQEQMALDREVSLLEAHHIPISFPEEVEVPEEYRGKTVLCIVTIANDREVIRLQPTQYRKVPYLLVPFIPKNQSAYGIGVCQALEQLSVEFNTRRNQSLDANTFGLYCMILANTKYIKKQEQLKIRPNGVIEVKGVDRPLSEVVQFVRPPVEYVTAAQNLLDRIEGEIVRTTRLKGNLGGEKIAPNPSATEASSIIKESMKSVKIILKRIDRDIVQEYFDRAYTLMVLNRQKPWFISTSDMPGTPDPNIEQFMEVLPSEIYTDGINIEVLGSAHVEDEIITRNQNMQLVDLMAKYSQLPLANDQGQPVKFNFYKALNEILYSFDKSRPGDWWTAQPPAPPPEPKEENVRMSVSMGLLPQDLNNPQIGGMLGAAGIKVPPPSGAMPPQGPMRPTPGGPVRPGQERPGGTPHSPQSPMMGDGAPNIGKMLKKEMNRPSRGI